jgi:hypothetical protein
MVRPLRFKQRGPKCSWCAVKATHRGFGFGRFACPQHLDDLTAWDRREALDHSEPAGIYS